MQRDGIVQKLRERGLRITQQRLVLLDIILEENCASCKEIFYKASKIERKIGVATVYRMINTLEEIGAIDKRNPYKITENGSKPELACTVEYSDGTTLFLSEEEWKQVVQTGLEAHGYDKSRQVQTVVIGPA